MDPDGSLGILPGTTGQVDPSSAWPIAGSTGIAAGAGTGQYGITPVVGGMTDTLGEGVTDVWDWLNKPFTTPMAPLNIFLLVGIVILAALVWNLILYHVRIAAETI
jgi:hypothetical protein